MEDNKEKVWSVLTQPAGLAEIEYGDILTLADFIECCRSGEFIDDDDGFGKWATSTHVDRNAWIFPSAVKCGREIPPAWATHVVWYNK